ncbi:MAG: hypothetical protein MJ093_04880 [Saccharofermentans sp.]|nr:hypothetical protein [Saccharofermentans sp.]
MKKITKFVALILVVVMLFALAGCYFKSPSADSFTASLTEVLEAPAADIRNVTYPSKMSPIPGCKRIITYYGGGVSSTYYEFSDPKIAMEYFERYHESFEDIVEASNFSGQYKKSISGSRGYVYFDGQIFAGAASYSMFGVGNVYGGAYYEGNAVVVIMTNNGGEARTNTRNVLKDMGYPYIK